MKMKHILGLALSVSILLSSVPVMAKEGVNDIDQGNIKTAETMSSGIQPYTTVPDDCEPNNTKETAYPYERVPEVQTDLTNTYDLYRLGMRHAGLHSATDEDWYSIKLTAGQRYFVDLRNVGKSNWFIEVNYYVGGEQKYHHSTNPKENSVYEKKPEKYLYFTAETTGTYYIRIANGGDWSDEMHYFFYVGPVEKSFDIVNMNLGTVMLGSTYKTFTCDLRNKVPTEAIIENVSITNQFLQGTACPEVSKYMSAGGRTYYNQSYGNNILNIQNVPLGQLWTIGAKCAKGSHQTTYWTAMLNGRFRCKMGPYPGNELPIQ